MDQFDNKNRVFLLTKFGNLVFKLIVSRAVWMYPSLSLIQQMTSVVGMYKLLGVKVKVVVWLTKVSTTELTSNPLEIIWQKHRLSVTDDEETLIFTWELICGLLSRHKNFKMSAFMIIKIKLRLTSWSKVLSLTG